MTHVFGRRILTAKTRFDTMSAPVRGGVHKVTRDRFFCKHIGLYLVSSHFSRFVPLHLCYHPRDGLWAC